MSAEHTTYTVKSGDSLGRIATHHGLSLGALLRANPQIDDPDRISVGQKINVPTQGHAPEQFPKTASTPEAQKYDHYAPFFAQQGVNVDGLPPGERIILGLRVKTNTKANKGLGLYDDRIVVVWRDADGTKHVREFEGTTEPSARYQGRYGSDADLNGVPDLGCLDNGVYEYQRSKSGKYGDVLCPCVDIDVLRDIDGSGTFDDKDKALVRNEAALNSKLSILFHKGGNSMTGSAGCQTMKPADFQKFWQALGTQKRFKYVLVTLG